MMSKKEVHQFLTELHNIARELGKPIDDDAVICTYSDRNNGYSVEISDTIVQPIYYSLECTKVLSPL